jgi:hypothetical protein
MTYLKRCVTLVILVSPFSMADTALDELSICAKNDDSLQRLVCFDKLADKAKKILTEQQQNTHLLPAQVTSKPLDNPSPIGQKSQSKPVLVEPDQAEGSLTDNPRTVVSNANIISQQQANFGNEGKQSTEDLINQIKTKIVEVKKDRYGNQTITFSNGQVWRQLDSTRLRLKKDQMVIIERGALGSFFIGKKDANKRIRANRVR